MEENNQNLSKKERQELKKEEKINKQISEQKKKRLTSIFLWSFITLFVVGTITTMVIFASKNPDTKFVGGTVKAADESDWVRGPGLKDTSSKVTLIEYSDFQCPACASYHPVIKQIEKDFPALNVVYRHFPLPQHANARLAAQVAEAAGAQGKFWEIHDLLFENQSIWSEEKNPAGVFEAYAKKLDLDLDKFRTDANAQAGKTKIDADVQSVDKEITGTPTFFINNKKIENPRNYDEFRSVIEKAISNS